MMSLLGSNYLLCKPIGWIHIYLYYFLFYFILWTVSDVLVVFQEHFVTIGVVPAKLVVNRLELNNFFVVIVRRLPLQFMNTVKRQDEEEHTAMDGKTR